MYTLMSYICVPGAAPFFSFSCSFVVLSARLELQGLEVVLAIWGGKAKEDDAQWQRAPGALSKRPWLE
jgi:hypothetical protein